MNNDIPWLMYHAKFYVKAAEKEKRASISWALKSDSLDDFIALYKDGWNGVEGQFAMRMARVLEQLKGE